MNIQTTARKSDIEYYIYLGEVLLVELFETEPEIETIQSSRNVSDLLQRDVVLRHSVQHLLDVEEAARALHVEQRQEFSGVLGDLSRDVLIILESEEDELLNILNNLGLPQIIYTDASEKRE